MSPDMNQVLDYGARIATMEKRRRITRPWMDFDTEIDLDPIHWEHLLLFSPLEDLSELAFGTIFSLMTMLRVHLVVNLNAKTVIFAVCLPFAVAACLTRPLAKSQASTHEILAEGSVPHNLLPLPRPRRDVSVSFATIYSPNLN